MNEKETIFHTLYQEYHGVLYKTCISFTGNPAKADETVQEAFVRLWIVWIPGWIAQNQPIKAGCIKLQSISCMKLSALTCGVRTI